MGAALLMRAGPGSASRWQVQDLGMTLTTVSGPMPSMRSAVWLPVSAP